MACWLDTVPYLLESRERRAAAGAGFVLHKDAPPAVGFLSARLGARLRHLALVRHVVVILGVEVC